MPTPKPSPHGAHADLAIVGCGPAGLMAAIWAARTSPGLHVLGLDGARLLGAKILVSGGGRCNVTHDVVRPEDYNADSLHSVRNVLAGFGVDRTIAFFHEIGVELTREETGKLFPVSDRARDVLDALVDEARRRGVELLHPFRVRTVEAHDDGFRLVEDASTPRSILARRVVLATGGRSLPKSGSDGSGYDLARSLGHTITRTIPALVGLTLRDGDPLRTLAGVTLDARLDLRDERGKPLASFRDSTLLTHFGLSGPSVLDISRHVIDARHAGRRTTLSASWLPSQSTGEIDGSLLALAPRASIVRWLSDLLPERLARVIVARGRLEPDTRAHELTRASRLALATAITSYALDVVGDRGFTLAEVTAGGVPVPEIRLAAMESRIRPGLFLCGEILDVDGRVGGYNFQWAWATGFLAGTAAARRFDAV